MTVPTFLFYMLSAILLGSSVLVVTARNMVHSVLFLILTFLNAAGLFILAHAEFLAMTLVIVYVGAIAVLFLFIVMMLNGEREAAAPLSRSYKLLGGLVSSILITELIILGLSWNISPEAFELALALHGTETNTEVLGNLIYTHYIFEFQMAGIILFIAIVGAIVLTLRHREGVLKQKVQNQFSRSAKDSIRLVDLSDAP